MPRLFSYILLSLAALAVALGGCRNVPPFPTSAELSTSALSTHLSRLTDPIPDEDPEAAARRTQYVSEQLRRAGLQPAVHGSFLLAHGPHAGGTVGGGVDPSQAHVMGYVAGRNPRFTSQLVLVTGNIDRPGGAALLEVARLVAADAQRSLSPETTVGFALWGPPRSGPLGVSDYLRRPTWAPGGIAHVLIVAIDTSGVALQQSLWAGLGISSEVVSPLEVGVAGRTGTQRLARTFRLAEATYLRVHEVASRTFTRPVPPSPPHVLANP